MENNANDAVRTLPHPTVLSEYRAMEWQQVTAPTYGFDVETGEIVRREEISDGCIK